MLSSHLDQVLCFLVKMLTKSSNKRLKRTRTFAFLPKQHSASLISWLVPLSFANLHVPSVTILGGPTFLGLSQFQHVNLAMWRTMLWTVTRNLVSGDSCALNVITLFTLDVKQLNSMCAINARSWLDHHISVRASKAIEAMGHFQPNHHLRPSKSSMQVPLTSQLGLLLRVFWLMI